MAKKPLLFGVQTNDSEVKHFADEYAYENFDPSYVPGYGEQQKANDIATSQQLTTAQKAAYYQRYGKQPGQMPAELMWVRVSGVNGAHSTNAAITATEYRRKGYRQATVADLEKHGWGMPPTAHVEADGSIRREDVALWIVDGERARYNAAEQAAINAEFHALKPSEGHGTSTPIEVIEHSHDPNFTLSKE